LPVTRPLPPHFAQRAANIRRPGFTGCFTGGKPVPRHAGQRCSADLLIGFFIGSPLSALLQPITWRTRRRRFAYFNLSVVDVREQLVEVAHVEPFSAARALRSGPEQTPHLDVVPRIMRLPSANSLALPRPVTLTFGREFFEASDCEDQAQVRTSRQIVRRYVIIGRFLESNAKRLEEAEFDHL
jgi:hypothetical protein